MDLQIWNRNLEDPRVLWQLHNTYLSGGSEGLSQNSSILVRPTCPERDLVDWVVLQAHSISAWDGWTYQSLCGEREFALLNTSPSRWEHCQGKANFRPSSFDNVPLSVFLPLVRMKELGQSQSKKAFDPCNSVLKNILLFFFALVQQRKRGRENGDSPPTMLLAQESKRLTAASS